MTAETTTASITVLSIEPVAGAGKLMGLASVEVVLDGVPVSIHGIQIIADGHGTAIALPKYRASNGSWRPAINLPDSIRDAIGDMVLDAGIEAGILKKRIPA